MRGRRTREIPIGLGLQNRAENVRHRIAIESFVSGERLVETAPERPDVAAFVDHLSPRLLGAHVRRRSHDGAERRSFCQSRGLGRFRGDVFVGRQSLCQPEIQNLGLPLRRQLDVGRLQVSVDDALLVGRFERLGELQEQRKRFVERKRPSGQALRQRLALDELHDEDLLTFELLEPVERGDTGVVERGEKLGLTLEPRQALSILSESLKQHFDGYVAPKLFVPSPIDLPHPALSEQIDDFEGADSLSFCQRHGLGREA